MFLPDCYSLSTDMSLKSVLSIYEIMQILGKSLLDKTPKKELLTESEINQNVKEQYNLFNEGFLLQRLRFAGFSIDRL